MRPKVVGIGLNKTGTKTLGRHLTRWGYRHRTYDSNTTTESPSFRLLEAGRTEELLASMDEYDSFEDWPWPLLFREIDARYPDARFVLTTRSSPDVWFRSLCNMTVRLGPLELFEKRVYGSAMPQGRKREHCQIYETHNQAVRDHFADRHGKLLEICWDTGDDASKLARFLGLEDVDTSPLHANRSPDGVYDGDSLWRARLEGWKYRTLTGPGTFGKRFAAAVRRRLPGF